MQFEISLKAIYTWDIKAREFSTLLSLNKCRKHIFQDHKGVGGLLKIRKRERGEWRAIFYTYKIVTS